MAKAVSLVTERLKRRERHSTNRNLSTTVTQEQTADMLLVALKHTQFDGVTVSVLLYSCWLKKKKKKTQASYHLHIISILAYIRLICIYFCHIWKEESSSE